MSIRFDLLDLISTVHQMGKGAKTITRNEGEQTQSRGGACYTVHFIAVHISTILKPVGLDRQLDTRKDTKK